MRVVRGAIGLSLCTLGLVTPAGAQDVAPLDRPGPAPQASAADLRASLTCSGDLDGAARAPVLLTPATTVSSRENFGWNYEPYLRSLGIPYCASDLPGAAGQNMGDMQTRAEYVVHAIRRVHELGGKRMAVLGHSQGGMIMRWALRFWPDTRTMVDDVIGIAGTNHGSIVVPLLCVPDCAPALWQQRSDARFYAALNSGQETFAPISYTEIYSRTDQFVQPNLDDTGTSSLHTGDGRISNVALQEICPASTTDHLLVGTTDPVAAALATDALTHDGPADPARIDPAVCTALFMPGVDQTTALTDIAAASSRVVTQLALAERVPAEPPLACYTTAAGCPGQGAATPAPAARCRPARNVRLYLDRFAFRVTRVTASGRRLRIVRRSGRRSVTVPLARRPGATVVVRITGRTRSGRTRRTTRTYRVCAR